MRPRDAARGAHEHIERLLLVQGQLMAPPSGCVIDSSKNAKCRSYSAISLAHPHSSASFATCSVAASQSSCHHELH